MPIDFFVECMTCLVFMIIMERAYFTEELIEIFTARSGEFRFARTTSACEIRRNQRGQTTWKAFVNKSYPVIFLSESTKNGSRYLGLGTNDQSDKLELFTEETPPGDQL
jgi:hypothetical protein